MKKNILIVLSALLLSGSVSAMPLSEVEEIEKSVSAIQIIVKDGVVKVSGASGMVLTIYTLTCNEIATYSIESNAVSFRHKLPKGCYLFSVGKVVRKVFIQ